MRRLPDQSGSGGQRVQIAPSQASTHKRRAAKAVAAAAEEAARLLSGVRIGSGGAAATGGPKGTGKQHQQQQQAVSSQSVSTRGGPPAMSSVKGAAVRYQTHVGTGGGIYTFEVASGSVAAAAASGKGQTRGRSLVSEYMGQPGGRSGGAAVPTVRKTGLVVAKK